MAYVDGFIVPVPKNRLDEYRRLALHRIDAQLAGSSLQRHADEPADLYARVEAQYRANVAAYQPSFDLFRHRYFAASCRTKVLWR